MSYPLYDNHNNQLALQAPHRQSRTYSSSYYPAGEYAAYQDPMTVGVYGENYPQTAYPVYGTERTHSQYGGYDGYDDYAGGGYAASYASAPRLGRRRHSSMSYRRPRLDSYRRLSSMLIKFKRKGGFRGGVTLGEAMSNVRLSGNDSYSFQDLNVDHRGRIVLKIKWTGYTSMTYEIPVDGYEGRVQLQTIARRIARACVHFLQANMIPVSWDRVILYHLEEHSPGVWQPVLSTS